MKLQSLVIGMMIIGGIVLASLAISSFISPKETNEQPYITVMIYRDSVTYMIRDYNPHKIDSIYNMYNNNYQITITRLPR